MDSNNNSALDNGKEDCAQRRARIKRELDGYKVNSRDCYGRTIKNIFAKGDEYIVYQAEGDNLSLSFTTLIDPFDEHDQQCLSKNYNEIEEHITRFRAILERSANPLTCMKQASHGICLAIEGDINKGINIVNEVIDRINIEYNNRILAKFWYLLGSIILIAILTLIVSIVYFNRYTHFVSNNIEFFKMMAAATFAGYGGFISISLKLDDIKFDKQISLWHIMASAAQRILFSSLFGVFTYILISSELLFGFAVNSKIPIYGILTICFVAGFSEKMVPGIISKLEAQKG